MKTGITGLTLNRGYYHVRWKSQSTTLASKKKAIRKLWEMKLPEMREVSAGKSRKWIEGYITGLIQAGFISEEESLYEADLYEEE